MKARTLFLSVVAATILQSPLSLAGQEPGDIDYGELYVVQKRDEVDARWQGGMAYTYGFSNPYLSIHGAQLSLVRRIGQYVGLGVSPTVFVSSQKDVAMQLSQQLGAQNIQTEVFRPTYSAHAVAQLVPLSGMLNWFSASAVDFDFVFTLGGGLARYRQESKAIPSLRLAATPQFQFSSTLGMSAGVQTSLEKFSSGDWQNRIETLIGVVGRF